MTFNWGRLPELWAVLVMVEQCWSNYTVIFLYSTSVLKSKYVQFLFYILHTEIAYLQRKPYSAFNTLSVNTQQVTLLFLNNSPIVDCFHIAPITPKVLNNRRPLTWVMHSSNFETERSPQRSSAEIDQLFNQLQWGLTRWNDKLEKARLGIWIWKHWGKPFPLQRSAMQPINDHSESGSQLKVSLILIRKTESPTYSIVVSPLSLVLYWVQGSLSAALLGYNRQARVQDGMFVGP